jgi:hypothetical protein
MSKNFVKGGRRLTFCLFSVVVSLAAIFLDTKEECGRQFVQSVSKEKYRCEPKVSGPGSTTKYSTE